MPQPEFPPDLLARPGAQSVRLIARGYLDAAAGALGRLEDPDDAEALHDFRVAIRRLRTTIRAYRQELRGSAGSKVRRRLRDIAESTNRVREAEVALDWLRQLKPELTARERVGLRWLMRRLEERHASGLEHVQTDLRRSFQAVERRLRKGLAVYRQATDVGPAAPADSFAAVAEGVLREQAGELDRLLRAVRAPEDEEAHLARIAAKRLRYLLEPLQHARPAGAALLVRLQALQDRLGDLHDTIELAHEVRAAAEAAAAERAARVMDAALTEPAGLAQRRAVRGTEPRSGLIAVARRLGGRLTAQFAALQTGALGHGAAWLREIEAALGRSGPVTPHRIPVPVPPARRRRHRRQRI